MLRGSASKILSHSGENTEKMHRQMAEFDDSGAEADSRLERQQKEWRKFNGGKFKRQREGGCTRVDPMAIFVREKDERTMRTAKARIVTASRSANVEDQSPPIKSDSSYPPRRGTFQRHLRPVPGRPSSGTPTADTWIPTGSHGAPPSATANHVAARSRDRRAGHDGTCKQRGQGEIREFVSGDVARRRPASPVPGVPARGRNERAKKKDETRGDETVAPSPPFLGADPSAGRCCPPPLPSFGVPPFINLIDPLDNAGN